MEKLFLEVLNLSFAGGFAIICVIIMRLFLKRMPKIFSYSLWLIPMFRLICPFSMESVLSLFPAKTNPIPMDIGYMNIPKIDTGINSINESINSILPPASQYDSINPIQILEFIGSLIWLLGIVLLIVYIVISTVRLKKHFKNCIVNNNICITEKTETPFVIGFFKPIIYIPNRLSEKEKEYIILHERNHIKRYDYLFKIIGFLILCIHWFNPLVWIGYFLMESDMEMSCDEKVILNLGDSIKKEYSLSLLKYSSKRSFKTPLSFGGSKIKKRIKNILDFKKPKTFINILITAFVLTTSICLILNPVSGDNINEVMTETLNAISESNNYQKTNTTTANSDNNYPPHYLVYNTTETSELINKKDSLERLKNMNKELNNNFNYIEFSSQPLHYIGDYKMSPDFVYDNSFLYDNERNINRNISGSADKPIYVTNLNSIQLGEKIYKDFDDNIDSGRNFSSNDYQINDRSQPINTVLGYNYKKYYNIGDTLKVNIYGKDIILNIIGFYKEKTNTNLFTKSFDNSIIIPSYFINYPADSSELNYQQISYTRKNEGFIIDNSASESDTFFENLKNDIIKTSAKYNLKYSVLKSSGYSDIINEDKAIERAKIITHSFFKADITEFKSEVCSLLEKDGIKYWSVQLEESESDKVYFLDIKTTGELINAGVYSGDIIKKSGNADNITENEKEIFQKKSLEAISDLVKFNVKNYNIIDMYLLDPKNKSISTMIQYNNTVYIVELSYPNTERWGIEVYGNEESARAKAESTGKKIS